MRYTLSISPNWGISRSNVIDYKEDRDSAYKSYEEHQLGGVGGVVAVVLCKNGKRIRGKYLSEDGNVTFYEEGK